MTASSLDTSQGRSARRWFVGVGLLLLLCAGYTAAWYFASSALQKNVMRALGRQQQSGVNGKCVNLTLSGFPFSIALSCDKVDIDDSVKGVSASFNNLHASAHIYSPGRIHWSLQSPAEIRTSQGLTVSSAWNSLHSRLEVQGKGISAGSTSISGLKTSFVSSATGSTITSNIPHMTMNVRQMGNDLQAVIDVEKATTIFPSLPQPLPATTLNARFTLSDKAGLLDGSDAGHGIYGSSGMLEQATADIGQDRKMTLSGPFSIGEDGYISGQFKLQIDKIGPWRDSLRESIPDVRRTIDMASKLLKAMAIGQDHVSIDLTVDHGDVRLSGFIPLGKIPPI